MNCLILEDLPNEILRQVLSYLSPLNVLRGWWNINNRFNGIIASLDYTICLKAKTIRADKFQAIISVREQIISLVVSKGWCQLIDQFVNLRALRILGFAYPYSTSQIRSKSLPNLTHLDFFDDFDWDDFMGADNCHYARQFVQCHSRKMIKTPTVHCQTLRSVKFICCTSEALAALLRLAPNLIELDIGLITFFSLENFHLVSISKTTEDNEHPSFTPTPTHHFEGISHSNLRRVRIDLEPQATLKWVDTFLPSVPNITDFNLKIGRSYDVFSFTELHRIITERLPHLKQQNFHFEYFCLPKKFNVQKHRKIGPLFETMIAQQIRSGPMNLLRISVNRIEIKTYEDDSD